MIRVASKTLCFLSPLLLLLCLHQHATAQAVSDLPRAEYYVAKEIYGTGLSLEASEGFLAALNRARRVGEDRWVDSIPPLVMLGECYYQQGSLALALEQYDRALMLALEHPLWIDQIEVGTEQLPRLEGIAKGINWFPKSRPSQSVSVPEALQIAIDPTQAQADGLGNVVAPVSLVTRLDAQEVIRTLGIALLRRWQVLGPLAKHSPLSEPLSQLFSRQPAQRAAWVNSSWSVLRGLSQLSTRVDTDAPGLIRSGSLIADQFDYFLSPLALIAGAEIAARSGNYQAAIANCQDAALLAAHFEQHPELASSIEMLSAAGAASFRTDLVDPLQDAAAWCKKRSNMSFAAANIGAAELAIYAANLALADRLAQQASLVLRTRETMPRYQAQLAFTRALLAFGQNRGVLGLSHLDTALKLMRGTQQSGAVVESIFQGQMTLDFFANGVLTANDTEAILDEIIAEPSAQDWQLRPLHTIARLTTSSLPAFERHLAFASTRGDEPATLVRMARLQNQRLYESLPLGGRLFNWRQAIGSPINTLPASNRDIVKLTNQQFPELQSGLQQIEAIVQELKQEPMPIDERQVNGKAKRRFSEMTELVETHENHLAFQSLLRKPLARYVPGVPLQGDIQKTLKDDDALISFAVTGRSVFGLAATNNGLVHWRIDNVALVDELLAKLPVEIGLLRAGNGKPQTDVMEANPAWRETTTSLRDLLLPAEVQDLVVDKRRLIIAPSDRLWYVPFELLPDKTNGETPLLANRKVTYIPMIGSLSQAFNPRSNNKETLGLVGEMFSLDSSVNTKLADSVVAAAPNTTRIQLDQKIQSATSLWLRIRSQQLWVATRLEAQSSGWELPIMPLGRARSLTIGNWLETPQRAPNSVVLPGLATSIAGGKPGNGNDLFLPICGMLFSGTKSAVVSRWPVGGKTTAALLARYLEETRIEAPSTALRRAILAQWPEDCLLADEPALLPAGKDSVTTGAHPVLWAGYMSIGDTP